MKFDVCKITYKRTHKLEIIGKRFNQEQFDSLCKALNYNIKKKDNTLLGYYFINNDGNAIVTCATIN